MRPVKLTNSSFAESIYIIIMRRTIGPGAISINTKTVSRLEQVAGNSSKKVGNICGNDV